MKINILVIHGYVQSAATVRNNTRPLAEQLKDIATLNYVDGPPVAGGGDSRPWWILARGLEPLQSSDRWDTTVKWWSDHLSKNQYDGVIGLSQGSAMAALLVSMLNNREAVPNFKPTLPQPLKFAIFCSGFVSHISPHKEIYRMPDDLMTLHTVDLNDPIVPASRTTELQMMCKKHMRCEHHEGHSIPVQGNFPELFEQFILANILEAEKTAAAATAVSTTAIPRRI